jgi:hypothetical protein
VWPSSEARLRESTVSLTSQPRRAVHAPTTTDLRHLAAVLAAVMAAIYALIWLGVLSVGRAETGELGILGVAGGVFLLLAVALWRTRSRVLWASAAVLQLLLTAMYVAIAPERQPHYELWGVTLRVLGVALLVLLATLLVRSRAGRDAT